MIHAEDAHRILPRAPFLSYEAYRSATGESAIPLAVERDPADLIAEMRASGLRGRGGAGFPTGMKWASLREHPCPTKYVVCNAAEGEPGTFKDRWLLRHNPYATIEGMRIAAHAIGAEKGYIALKGSFTREIDRVKKAIEELSARGLLEGFEIVVVEGPEEYLFGEEKALLNVIEGEGPLPREPDNPPYEVGLFATPGSPNPALVNNAETYAHVPSIVRHGAASFREVGTRDTPGTILVTLSGDLERPGVYEVPAGLSLRRVFNEYGGGPRPGRSFKAALSGVSSAVIVESELDTPLEFGAMAELGSGLGSAGFLLFDDTASMPRLAQMVARFLYVESCNQCSACKSSLAVASTALDELFDPGAVQLDAPERALLAARRAPQGNRCYLPVQGKVVIPSLIRRFASEFTRQTEAPMPRTSPIPIPKIVDFDEATRTFIFDDKQPLKQPNWTYREAPREDTEASAALPHHEELAVWLDPDVVMGMRRQVKNGAVDREVNRVLREWLEAHPKR